MIGVGVRHGFSLWGNTAARLSACGPIPSYPPGMAEPSRAVLHGKVGDVPADVQALHEKWRKDSCAGVPQWTRPGSSHLRGR